MESMLASFKRNGTDIYTDTSAEVRSQQRPTRRGQAFEDLGSSFGVTGPQKSSQPSSSQNSKYSIRHIRRQYQDVSDDEIDCFSQTSSHRSSRSPSRGPPRQKSHGTSKAPEVNDATVPPSRNPWEQGYQQSSLKGLKFKKTKDTVNQLGSVIEVDESPKRASNPGEQNGIARRRSSPARSNGAGPSSRPQPKPTCSSTWNANKERALATSVRHVAKDRSGAPAYSQAPAIAKKARSVSPVDLSSDDEKVEESTPRPAKKGRPQPRPVATESRMKDAIEARSARSGVAADARGDKKGKGRETSRAARTPKPQPFPLSPPKRSQDSQHTTNGKGTARNADSCHIDTFSPLSGNVEKVDHCPIDALSPPRTKVKGKAKNADDDPFSKLSPLREHAQPTKGKLKKHREPQAFPLLSPLSSQKARAGIDLATKSSRSQGNKAGQKSGGRAKITSSEDGSDDSDKSSARSSPLPAKLRPFPMETQVLASIGRSPPKRTSSSSDDELDVRHNKRRREDNGDWMAELLRSDDIFDAEDDSLFLDPTVDPNTLCPWCDERLPPVPTPYLVDLMKIARSKSSRDSRLSNPLGLRAPLTAYTNVCQRHRFESIQVPRAQRKGWPTEIAWDRLPARVEAQRERLQAIVDDVDEQFLPGAVQAAASDDALESRPRKGSEFWQYVRKSVKEHGSKKAAGVREQLGSFSRTQPGYYGELGYVIINQAIYDMFPPSSFDPDAVLPLTPTNFIQLILVPEAAVSLIMEDMHQTRAEAVVTLQESAEYGVAMFPDDHTEGSTAIEAGEQIVMDRALARRKVLEVEERLEEEMFKAQENSSQQAKQKRKPRPRPVEKGAATGSEADYASEPKLRTRQASRRLMGSQVTESSSDEDDNGGTSDDYIPGAAQKRKRKNKPSTSSAKAGSKAPRSTVPSDSETVVQEKPRPKPRPVFREAKSSQSQGKETGKEKENAPSASESDSGSPDVWRMPPSNQQARARQVNHDDATPRPVKTSRSSSITSTTAAVGTGRKALLPLQAARERSARMQARTDDRKARDTWSYRPRDELNSSDRDSGLKKAQSSTRTEDSSWLLSDPPSSSQ
ncbi:hypothetical protein OBBRIDRAFT_787434 [Obba rivulosa]|uniref:Restriction of telomere capping protein 4 n=1 Tax=Obba rivulosa TaxID=1052685 RepID=A0A8E2DV01_9APHY|nr:hypothetical protein OBBRIDRAFT_787434 [Obba rivulosa]